MRKFDRKQIKEDLKEIMTKDTVFVCVGTNKVVFDLFGPLCGDYLKRKNIPYFGDCEYNVNALTMEDRLKEIYNKNKLENKNIIAIDAAVTDDDEKVNKVLVNKERGIYPGAGVGKKFPMIGNKAIMMFTLNRTDLKYTMEMYRTKSLNEGKAYDRADLGRIKRYATDLVDIIEEVYNEVCYVEMNI